MYHIYDLLEQNMPKRPQDAIQLVRMTVDISTGAKTEPDMNVKQKAGELGGFNPLPQGQLSEHGRRSPKTKF